MKGNWDTNKKYQNIEYNKREENQLKTLKNEKIKIIVIKIVLM